MSVDDDDDGLVVSEEYQCDDDKDDDDANDFFPIKPTNLVVSAEYQCDGDGDDEKDGDDDAKICWFFAYQIHKSCCLRRDGAVQQDLLFYWLYFGDRLYLWEYILAYPQENISPRFVANISC